METQHHNVILFGAGASFDAGIPLLGTFVDRMWDYSVRGKIRNKPIPDEDRKILTEAHQIRRELESYNSRASFDMRNLEDILSLLLFEALANPANQIKYDTMVKAVSRTIELSCNVEDSKGSAPYPSIDAYVAFWRQLLEPKLRPASPAIITFNYDLVLERSLWRCFHRLTHEPGDKVASCGISYHYGLYDFIVKGGRDCKWKNDTGTGGEYKYHEKAEVTFPYLKLHGSLNWDKHHEIPQKDEQITPNLPPTTAVEEPFILPPVFNKMNSKAINRVWSTAVNILRQAKNIIIVGYSLPKTDIYMQYFLKAAVGPNSDLQKIIVFDPVLSRGDHQSQEMRDRFSACFAPQFLNRIDFFPSLESNRGVSPGTFKHFLHMLQTEHNQLLFMP